MKTVLFSCVAAIVFAAVIAICWTGIDRSGNEEARAKQSQASAIGEQAQRLEASARQIEAPQPKASAEVELPSRGDLARAAKLRRQAAKRRRQATKIEREGLEGRSLDFLAGIQLVGLIVGIAGGWLFSEATPLRVGRLRAKADRLRARLNSVVEDEAGAADAAYGHFQAELAVQGVDVSAHGHPDYELEKRLLHERSLSVQSGNGRVRKEAMTGGGS